MSFVWGQNYTSTFEWLIAVHNIYQPTLIRIVLSSLINTHYIQIPHPHVRVLPKFSTYFIPLITVPNSYKQQNTIKHWLTSYVNSHPHRPIPPHSHIFFISTQKDHIILVVYYMSIIHSQCSFCFVRFIYFI